MTNAVGATSVAPLKQNRPRAIVARGLVYAPNVAIRI